ncbi:MAG: pimeloyl-ACP methyl esterase BioG family protein [Paracoccaceae bacterium]
MEAEWISRTGTRQLIVVFGGWAIGAEPFRALPCESDLLFLSDYCELDWTARELTDYDDADLLAWSFGVAAYAYWQSTQPEVFARKAAINGTLAPVDRRTGIPPAIFQRTLETLSVESFPGFVSRVFNEEQKVLPIDVEARCAELKAIQERGVAPDVEFDRIWVSDKDRIFPPANMNRAWEHQSGNLKTLTGAAHAPFAHFSSLEEMLT